LVVESQALPWIQGPALAAPPPPNWVWQDQT
jgi:hypothetical protein